VASALRATGASPDSTPRTARAVASLGAPIFGRQSPDGWPETGDAWMNAGAIRDRINFGVALAAGRLPGASPARTAELERLRSAPRAEQADAVVDALLGGEASPATREIQLRGESPLEMVGLALGAPEFQRR
jgi:uncharacterized protein (DUF1800 family)